MMETERESDAYGPAILRKAFADRRVIDRQGNSVALTANVAESEAAHLHAVVRALKPEVSVEVGFAQGVSTLAILDALKRNNRGHHHVIDPFQAQYDYCGCAMVEHAGFADRYTFHEKFADEVIPGLPAIGFAFIDSSHLFDLTMAEFVMTDRKLAVGGVIGFHDMWMPSQQAFVRYVLANRAYDIWLPAGQPSGADGGSSWKRRLRAALARLPGSERIFAADFLKPWGEFKLGNLVFLRKTAADQRDWRFHQRF